jgi:DNA-binding GntR family transcriptional regulator
MPRRSRTHEVAEAILGEALRLGLAAGDRLPPERAFAERLSVSRGSVRQAIQLLENAGLVEGRSTRGAYLRTDPPQQRLTLNDDDDLAPLDVPGEARPLVSVPGGDQLGTLERPRVPQGLLLQYTDLAPVGLYPADPRLARRMRIAVGTPVQRWSQLVSSAGGMRLRLIESYFRVDLLQHLLSLSRAGTLRTADECRFLIHQQAVARIAEEILARDPTGEERHLLRLTRAVPLLVIKRTAYDVEGQVLEWTRVRSLSPRSRLVQEYEVGAGSQGALSSMLVP